MAHNEKADGWIIFLFLYRWILADSFTTDDNIALNDTRLNRTFSIAIEQVFEMKLKLNYIFCDQKQ